MRDMTDESARVRDGLKERVPRRAVEPVSHVTAVDGRFPARRARVNEPRVCCRPCIGRAARGRKRVLAGGDKRNRGPGGSLVAGVDMPGTLCVPDQRRRR